MSTQLQAGASHTAGHGAVSCMFSQLGSHATPHSTHELFAGHNDPLPVEGDKAGVTVTAGGAQSLNGAQVSFELDART